MLDAVHWTCAFCAAAWLAWRAARSATGNLRRVRRRFAAGLIVLAAGQLTWDLLAWVGWNPFPGIPNLLYLGAEPVLHPRLRGDGRRRGAGARNGSR